jgi:predicted enzyme related to lactoylglutathione lyase
MKTVCLSAVLVILTLSGLPNSTVQAQDFSQSKTATGKETTVANQHKNNRIDYIEFPATNIAATKKFYTAVFGWTFTDYGPDYVSFEDGQISGGFTKVQSISRNGTLVVLYASDLEKTQATVVKNGGTITKTPFTFPGGRRFHFTDPNGNELAVWSEK